MKESLDALVGRAIAKRSMPLREFIRTENLQDYELGREDILYADAINVAIIPHEEYLILLRERWDDESHAPVSEYAVYWQEDFDGRPLINSANMNATYHLLIVGFGSFRNMAGAIAEAVEEIHHVTEENVAVVRDMTDGDPLADLTEEDTAGMIREAESLGYSVFPDLTPAKFLEIFEDLKQEE